MKWIILFLCIQLPAFAEEAGFEVQLDPDTYPVKAFEAKGTKASAMPKKPARGAIPDKEKRDTELSAIPGLDISGMDELDRDRLYVLARTVEFAQLRKSFPKIPEKALRALHQKLQR